ncbi:MAG: TAT-variant-translocated molybdopterin oxidoreductase [bacterium]|jgi:molybdopterin-containing oxidoreductase family iron-sulfur binding subunit
MKNEKTGREYWRSLEELALTPAFRQFYEREFPENATEMGAGGRRDFLRLMGASLALAGIGLTSCRLPEEHIVPYAHPPEGRAPGIPLQFATAMEIAGWACGLLVTSYDGRPIKVEGNPGYPMGRGATNSFHQASVLEIYDPDRSKGVVKRDGGKPRSMKWEEFEEWAEAHFGAIKTAQGRNFAVLSEASSSPTLDHLKGEFQKAFPLAKWYEWEPISRDNEREGSKLVFSRVFRSQYAFDRARCIVSFGDDFIWGHPASLKYSRDFARGRAADRGDMSRLYVYESAFTITGANADHRWAIPPSMLDSAVLALAIEIFTVRGVSLPAGASALMGVLKSLSEKVKKPEGIGLVAADLISHKARGAVVAGAGLSPAAHALVMLMNVALENSGRTVVYFSDSNPGRKTHAEAIAECAEACGKGELETLLIIGGNPAYDAPADLDFENALSKVQNKIRFGMFEDETSKLCDWHLPRAHYLESWDDARSWDGNVSVVQPLIEPLYGGRTTSELLALLLGSDETSGYEMVRKTFSRLRPAVLDVDRLWRQSLINGMVGGTQARHEQTEPGDFGLTYAVQNIQAGSEGGGIEIAFCQDYSTFDGRFANSPWLNELPDPMTKLVWDNAALVGPSFAKQNNLKSGDVVKLSSGGREISAPVFVMPGIAANTVVLNLGYGRKSAGRVGNGVGTNAYPLRTSDSLWFATGASIAKTGKRKKLYSTQDHHAIDMDALGKKETQKRLGAIYRQATLAEYMALPDFAKHEVHVPAVGQLYKEHEYNGHKWGMTIDLNSCIGCGVCTIACQAENNIPVVGKNQVSRGREMHWIRVDRYFKGDPENPTIANQPMTCHHCENAPCEQVCPVAATVHSAEGLNQMVYNRCVGTRYCSNNCPYKVRRFNFFNYRKDLSATERMQLNPEVTVRGRGVMEKCTFCIQRIESVKIKAKNENKEIRDGLITPACAQACPTQAIVFGDLNDERSRVRRNHENPRAYLLLEELNVRPRLSFLAKITNPNPELGGEAPEPHEGGHGE